METPRSHFLKSLPRERLLAEIRRAAGVQRICLWEQVPYGAIYWAVRRVL
jgi:hypothetical protein